MVAYPTPHREDAAFGLIRVGLSLAPETLGFLVDNARTQYCAGEVAKLVG